MPLLHISITSPNQNVSLPKELVAQKLTFIRANIYKDIGSGGADYQGRVFVNFDWFNGFEVNSNLVDNMIIVPIKSGEEVQTYQMEQTFISEDVKQSFNVKTYYYDPTNNNFELAPFKDGASTTGRIVYMDLFFQVSQIYDYTTY